MKTFKINQDFLSEVIITIVNSRTSKTYVELVDLLKKLEALEEIIEEKVEKKK